MSKRFSGFKKIQFYKLEFKTSCQNTIMSRKESDSEPALDDPSSHDIELLADTWVFKSHCAPWQWGRLFLSLKRLQAAAGAWPFNCLSHSMLAVYIK